MPGPDSRRLPRGRVVAGASPAVVAAEVGTLALGGVLAPMRFLLLWCAIMLSALVGGGVGGVVADDADKRALVRKILEMRGAHVTVASSADEALVAINREKPALVISDLAMPMIDGFTLATSVRGKDVGVNLSMIAFSAFGRAEDERQALDAEFNRFLRKPIDPNLLASTAAELMKR